MSRTWLRIAAVGTLTVGAVGGNWATGGSTARAAAVMPASVAPMNHQQGAQFGQTPATRPAGGGHSAHPHVACTWTYPGSPGSPGPNDDVCIYGTYSVGSQTTWNSLYVGGGGDVVIENLGGCGNPYPTFSLVLTSGGLIDVGGAVDLFSSNSCFEGGTTGLDAGSGSTLTNAGTIGIDLCFEGPCYGSNRVIQGSVINTGSIGVHTQLDLQGPGTFDNKGSLTTDGGQYSIAYVDAASPGQGLSFINDTGGSINSNGTGGPQFKLLDNNAFTEGTGTTSGPDIQVHNSPLSLTGAGASSIDLDGTVALYGNIAAGQTLTLVGSSGGNCNGTSGNTSVTVAGSFTNAGTINFCAGQNESLALPSGKVLTNSGTIQITSCCGGNMQIQGTVTNAGTVSDNGNANLTIGALTNYSSKTGRLSGGTYAVTCSCTLTVPGLDIKTNAATIGMHNGGSLSDGSTNSLASLTLNKGEVDLYSGTCLTTNVNLNNSGKILIDYTSGWSVNGSFSQSKRGQFSAILNKSSYCGHWLFATGTGTLSGTFALSIANGYTPSSGDSIRVFSSFGAVSGHFTKITGVGAGSGLYFVSQYDPNDVTVVVKATQDSVTPSSGPPGQAVQVSGSGFSPGEKVQIGFIDPKTHRLTKLAASVADGSGSFTISETIPATANTGTGSIQASGATSFVTVQTTFTVT